MANFLFIGERTIGLNIDQIHYATWHKDTKELVIFFACNDYLRLQDAQAVAVLKVLEESSSEAERIVSCFDVVVDPPSTQAVAKPG